MALAALSQKVVHVAPIIPQPRHCRPSRNMHKQLRHGLSWYLVLIGKNNLTADTGPATFFLFGADHLGSAQSSLSSALQDASGSSMIGQAHSTLSQIVDLRVER
ncbi:hypothetical protein LIA77_02644 [Sarocladium implicatum]|nr:hypothetical protein LIA77_02644 [Sarocladium implicatum]